MNKKELIKSVEELNFSEIKVFSTKAFRVMFLVGGIMSFIASLTLLILFLSK